MSACSKCGAPLIRLPDGRSEKYCLRCLLAYGIKDAHGPEAPADAKPATDEEIAGLWFQLEKYRLIEKLGEGGCGIVYRAEQLAPVRRSVAIKLIKLGMDSRNVIARFEQERQALAMMEHPGIAKVFDGGTTSTGRPFFVMELVAGQPLTLYSQKNRLNVVQRLEIFIELCQAVQHAHQKGIIHRDLKPSNVLVIEENGQPHPKVIDFGVARATARQRLADETIYTAFDQFVGTPAYMSPEQAGLTCEDVDTRSDIYSLGVLLYEVLTGVPPFDPNRLRHAALEEIGRIIREEEPVRPSIQLRQLGLGAGHNSFGSPPFHLAAELDWVVMKALEKEPARRYATAEALAADVRRYLGNEPVSASPPSRLYRFRKFMRRNRVTGVSVLLLAAMLLAGSIVSALLTVRAHRAEENERRLRAKAQQAAALAQTEAAAGRHVLSLINNSYSAWRPVPGRRRHTLAWTGVIESLQQREQTNQVESMQPALERLTALMQLADHAAWAGDFVAAENMLGEALPMSAQLGGGKDPLRAGILECLALVLRRAGKTNEAQLSFEAALNWRQQSQAADSTAIRASYAFAYVIDQARQRGDWNQAEQLGRQHVEALRQTYGTTNMAFGQALIELGGTFASQGKLREAGATYAQALATFRALPPLPNDPELPEICQNITAAFDLVAEHLRRTGQPEEAARLPAEALELIHHLQEGPVASGSPG